MMAPSWSIAWRWRSIVRDDNRIENLQLMAHRKNHPTGYESPEEVDEALRVLGELVNKGLSDGAETKKRLRRLARRL